MLKMLKYKDKERTLATDTDGSTDNPVRSRDSRYWRANRDSAVALSRLRFHGLRLACAAFAAETIPEW
jgi:hypothetical protein